MNSSIPIPSTSLSHSQPPRARAQFSPLLRRATLDALTRARVAARLKPARNDGLPVVDSLTPATPALVERWWNPHFLDRLQMPLTRFRD